MGDELIAVLAVLLMLLWAHLLTCPDCRQKTVDFLDDLVERIKFGRKNP